MGAFAVSSRQGPFLIFLVPLAVAGGLYPAAGRLIHRRVRISRSGYVLTDRRLIASWRLGRTPVTVQARLGELLPPVIRGQAIFTGWADSSRQGRSMGWRNLLWPTATTAPPALIGSADAPAVRELIAAAQLALRAPAQRRTADAADGGEGPGLAARGHAEDQPDARSDTQNTQFGRGSDRLGP